MIEEVLHAMQITSAPIFSAFQFYRKCISRQLRALIQSKHQVDGCDNENQ